MRKVVLLMSFCFALNLNAQERVTTFGFQAKPIIPSNLFRTGTSELSQNGIDYALNQQVGYSLGGVMRFGLTYWLSLESGISFVRRNFSLTIDHQEVGYTDTTSFRIIGYEIPVSGLVFVRLSDEIYMNASFGLAIDMFPSDVHSGSTQDFYQISRRRGVGSNEAFLPWTKLGLLANIGFEYRTKSSGYFYIGASYHRPFAPIYDTNVLYTYDTQLDRAKIPLSGNYLTIDFRYFFHEEPKKKKPDNPDPIPAWQRDK